MSDGVTFLRTKATGAYSPVRLHGHAAAPRAVDPLGCGERASLRSKADRGRPCPARRASRRLPIDGLFGAAELRRSGFEMREVVEDGPDGELALHVVLGLKDSAGRR